jgi:hypothetical protein
MTADLFPAPARKSDSQTAPTAREAIKLAAGRDLADAVRNNFGLSSASATAKKGDSPAARPFRQSSILTGPMLAALDGNSRDLREKADETAAPLHPQVAELRIVLTATAANLLSALVTRYETAKGDAMQIEPRRAADALKASPEAINAAIEELRSAGLISGVYSDLGHCTGYRPTL